MSDADSTIAILDAGGIEVDTRATLHDGGQKTPHVRDPYAAAIASQVLAEIQARLPTLIAGQMPVRPYSKRAIMRDEFPGPAIDAAKWLPPVVGSGHTVGIVANALVFTTGVTASTESSIDCAISCTQPVRVRVVMLLSQRIANQTFTIELISDDGLQVARFLFDGTTTTTGKVETVNGGLSSGQTAVTIDATSSYLVVEMVLTPDLVTFDTAPEKSTSQAQGRNQFQRRLPDPAASLHLRLRATNGATAPASSTTWTIASVHQEDFDDIDVRVARGSGDPSAQRALAVIGSVSGSFTPIPSSTSGGLSTISKWLSTAGTNATSVASAAAALGLVFTFNLGATDAFLKLYNKATAPTVGTDVPVAVIPLKPGVPVVISWGTYQRLSVGCAFAITGGIADSDTTTIAANQVALFISRA